MQDIAVYLAEEGWTLRSGGAGGADTAFETGADKASGSTEIYLPWVGFNNRKHGIHVPMTSASFTLAQQHHPNWSALSNGGQNLMVRNNYQVLGPDLETPSQFVICWTPGGLGGGGTGQAIRLANTFNIPVLDLCNKSLQAIEDFINKYMEPRP